MAQHVVVSQSLAQLIVPLLAISTIYKLSCADMWGSEKVVISVLYFLKRSLPIYVRILVTSTM